MEKPDSREVTEDKNPMYSEGISLSFECLLQYFIQLGIIILQQKSLNVPHNMYSIVYTVFHYVQVAVVAPFLRTC